MKRIRSAMLALTLTGFLAIGQHASAASSIDSSIAIPDSVVLLNFNNSGLDWVYAGPIAPNEWGTGNIEPASYRASEGWRAATVAEWASHPGWMDFIKPGATVSVPIAGLNDHSVYLFASEYWSFFSHVDLNDFANGSVTDGVNGVVSGVPETIYVRDSRFASVPEPATVALLCSGIVGLGLARRRKARPAA